MPVKVNCQYCGKEFETIPYYVKTGGAKFCGRDCTNKGSKPRPKKLYLLKNCLNCNKEFGSYPKQERKYCSRKCSYIYRTGINSGTYKHGGAKTIEYSTWLSMRQRCTNPHYQYYYLYGGKGIKVCERWNDYDLFIKDMGKKPGRNYSIERIDSDKDYCPENCRWATPKEQANNTSRNVKITYKGVTKTKAQWAEYIGITRGSLDHRLRDGWTFERILSTPNRKTVKLEYTYKGVTKRLHEWAKEYGMKRTALYQRLYYGWDFEKAINTPFDNDRFEKFEYKGELKTMSQLAKSISLDPKTLRSRIRRGWSIEKAMETPLKKKK